MLNHPIGRFIYIFHMPLFFFISGLVDVHSFQRPLGELVGKKFRAFIMPLRSVAGGIERVTNILAKELMRCGYNKMGTAFS